MISLTELKKSLSGCLLLVATVTPFVATAAPSTTAGAVQAQMIPAAPAIEARGYVLMDAHSGEIIAAKNADQQMAPASLTKIMTAYIIGQELNQQRLTFTDPVTISRTAWSRNFPDSSKMFIKPGDAVSVADLTRGIMIQSGNDACVAMAEHIAGSEEAFVSLMNSWAEQLGMTGSNFVNAHGLDGEGISTTPLDMAVLLQRMIRDTPQIYKIYSEKSFTWANISQQNRNRLLWDKSLNVDGGKTGYTSNAGYSLAASAVDGDMRLVSVVMGTASAQARIQETRKLMNYGFRFYGSKKVAEQNMPLMISRVWMGAQQQLPVTVAEDVYVTLPRARLNQLQAEFELQPQLAAPVTAGQVVGMARWRQNGEVVQEAQLVAGIDIAEGDLLQQLQDQIMMRVDSLIQQVKAAIF
ncbi:MAG: D-alanyl-D-alanine carboxypeptidase [Marinobacterium sp.]|nr:D-alanyl-D-alanine carboxypeptidase [Marinobacterium sp.]